MPFDKLRTDVRKALQEASVSGARIKIEGKVFERNIEEVGFVKSLASDRVVLGVYRTGRNGRPIMLRDIRCVSFWKDPGDPRAPSPDPEPVGDPPPKAGSPGKREKVPEPSKMADAHSTKA